MKISRQEIEDVVKQYKLSGQSKMPSDEIVYKADHGFYKYELYNLDGEIAAFILPRLYEYRKSCSQWIPSDILESCDGNEAEAYKKWKKILKKMIVAFYYVAKGSTCSEEEDKKVEKGLRLFSKYLTSLWT